jgi:hypothetical protein
LQILRPLGNKLARMAWAMMAKRPGREFSVHGWVKLIPAEGPGELIDLYSVDYLGFTRCRAVLATSIARWKFADITPAQLPRASSWRGRRYGQPRPANAGTFNLFHK